MHLRLPSINALRTSLTTVLLSLTLTTHAAEPQNLVNLDAANLAEIKTQLTTGTAKEATQAAYNILQKQAEEALGEAPESVIEKSITPPSGDMQDYLSLSRYWWPNDYSKDGLPWVQKDGKTNPDTQNDKVDRLRLGRMAQRVSTLSLAYYYSGDERFAEHASSIIRTWFIDKKTRMNPNVTYGQTVMGNPKPRRSGILDGRLIPQYVFDSIALIRDSKHWKKSDDKAMKKWAENYLEWIVTSKVGKHGSEATNNHGSWYYFQVAALADYLGDEARLKFAFDGAKNLLDKQFKYEGNQPSELKRTRSFSYSCFNLEAHSHIAFIAAKHDEQLWNYPLANDSIMQSGINYLTPAINGGEWPHKSPGVEPGKCLQVLAHSVGATGKNRESLSHVLALVANGDGNNGNLYRRIALTQPGLMD